jgi:hypothetical protein
MARITKSGSKVSIEAKAEADRKKQSKAALKAALAAQNAATFGAPVEAPRKGADDDSDANESRWDEAAKTERDAEAKANALAALRVDYDALREAGSDEASGTFEEYVAAQGVEPDGKPQATKTPYQGSMLALKLARVAYVKAKNGIQCNGDKLATLCGAYTREQTVAALILALDLEGNPYTKLNPGQQSMNLRNKARHAINTGILSFAKIEAAYKRIVG